jgi:pilus assembly protein CpaE
MANILVIDDDKDIQRLLEFTLKRAGHTVDTAIDGGQGMQFAEAHVPDLIVCDVMMPKMNGYEFCRQARTKSVLKSTPIIVFSARFQPVDKQTALDAGATDYLSKSTAPDQLVKRINELIPAQSVQKEILSGVFAIFSLRGGAGVTSLSVNLALAMMAGTRTATTVVDLAPMGGHAALMLGLRPSSNINQLMLNAKATLTPDEIQSYMLKHQSGLQLLASTPGFDASPAPGSQLVALIGSIKSGFPLTVLDVPGLLDANTSPVLQLLDRVILVLTPDMPAVQSTVTALQGLAKLGIPTEKVKLVVNQTIPKNMLPIEIIQKTVRRPVNAAIPFDPNMVKAVNSGVPLLLGQPDSPAAVAIASLSGKILN